MVKLNLVFWMKLIIGGVTLLKVAQIFCDVVYNIKARKNLESFRLQIYAKTNSLYSKQQIRNALDTRLKISFVEILVVLAIGLVLVLI